MSPNFLLKMTARDKDGKLIEITREILFESAINDTAFMLMTLAIMDGLKDIHVVGVAHILENPSQN